MIAQLPAIAAQAGYALFSRLIARWLTMPRRSEPVTLAWPEIEQADDAGILRLHLAVARAVVRFSMIATASSSTPSLVGFRSEVRSRVVSAIQSLAKESGGPHRLQIEVLKVFVQPYSATVDETLVSRLHLVEPILRTSGTPELLDDYRDIQASIRAFNQKRSRAEGIEDGQAWVSRLSGTGIRVRFNQLAASLGRFTLLVGLEILVDNESWRVVGTTYRVQDVFDFEGWQPLGSWTVNGLEIGPGAIYLENADFRRYSERFGVGGAFLIESEWQESMASGPFAIPRSKSG